MFLKRWPITFNFQTKVAPLVYLVSYIFQINNVRIKNYPNDLLIKMEYIISGIIQYALISSTCLQFPRKASSTLSDVARFTEPESCARGSTQGAVCEWEKKLTFSR